MVLPQTPSQHPYSLALQLRLYQAFIFSIPILFSIILFLLFYLFYLKRRASTLPSSPQGLPGNSTQSSSYFSSVSDQTGFKKELKDKLPIVLFDEELRIRDSQCCVCLGEFEIKEELLQIPSCNHVFHAECINHWLQTNTTCPLCRCFVPTTNATSNATTNPDEPPQPSGHVPLHEVNVDSTYSQHIVASLSEQQRQEQQQQEDQVRGGGSPEQVVIQIEEEPRSQSSSRSLDIAGSSGLSILIETERVSSNGESVIVHIQTHGL